MKIFGDSFKNLGVGLKDNYVNPNDLQDMSNRLHVCETLFGDFDARVLIVLQDAADVDTLLTRARAAPNAPILRHGEDILTNRRLVDWFSDYFNVSIDGHGAAECGIYYANSVWLLKRSGGMSGSIKKSKEVTVACKPVLLATLRNLQSLEVVISFGAQAHKSMCGILNIDETWSSAKENKTPNIVRFDNRKLRYVALNHPAARIPPEITKARLRTLLSRLGFNRGR